MFTAQDRKFLDMLHIAAEELPEARAAAQPTREQMVAALSSAGWPAKRRAALTWRGLKRWMVFQNLETEQWMPVEDAYRALLRMRQAPLLDSEAMAAEILQHCAEIGHVAFAITTPVAIFVDITEGRVISIEQAYREIFGA